MSLRNRLLLLIILLVSFVIVTVSTLEFLSAQSLLKANIEAQTQKDLDAKRAQLTGRIENYIHTIELQIVDLAADPFIVNAAQEFSAAFERESASNASTLSQYYQNAFKNKFNSLNTTSVDVNGLFNRLSPIAKHFQQGYIQDNSYPLGEKDKFSARPDVNQYDQAHQKYHGRLHHFLDSFSYYDIFIVDTKNNHIVYSVFKEIDYATNLETGPFNSSGIADAYRQAKKLSRGDISLTDFAEYLPSYNAPASFMATPIFSGSERVGVLIFQMPINVINNLMTVDQKWREQGFGDSGEIYLVGADNKLRNESRFFIEDPTGYFSALAQNNVPGIEQIKSRGTSISNQRVDSTAANAALKGNSGFDIVLDYRQVPVASSYGPVQFGPHQWAILSEIDEAEAFASLQQLKDTLFTEVILEAVVMIIIASIIAFLMSRSLTKPINLLGRRLNEMAQGEADLTQRIRKFGIAELDQVGSGFNSFVSRLQKIMSNVKASIDTIAAASTELGATTEQTSYANKEQNNQTQQISQAISAIMSLVEENQALTIEALENTDVSRDTTKVNTERAALAENNIRQLVEEVTGSSSTLSKLQEEVKSIEDVLSVINSIADQTNLLALNAAIEAARAGEYGRGFAVVADEVRNLASKTQESTVTIQEQIARLTTAAEHSVDSMNRASVSAQGGIHLVATVNTTLNELLNNIATLTEVNKKVAKSGDTQAGEMAKIKNSIESLASASIELAESSDNIANSANDLSSVAESLMSETKEFKV
ncbi:MAG: methyl-accepting chemotaxis protein [Gammaproteobacteria bacterium]|nr:methyl-accepting chemotaxis protein [Gammaproteobacteria bacterium]